MTTHHEPVSAKHGTPERSHVARQAAAASMKRTSVLLVFSISLALGFVGPWVDDFMELLPFAVLATMGGWLMAPWTSMRVFEASFGGETSVSDQEKAPRLDIEKVFMGYPALPAIEAVFAIVLALVLPNTLLSLLAWLVGAGLLSLTAKEMLLSAFESGVLAGQQEQPTSTSSSGE